MAVCPLFKVRSEGRPSIQVQAGLKGPHRSHRQEWWHILLHDSETDHSVVSGQSDWHVGARGRCRTSCTARRLWFLLAPFWRPCSASRFPHRSSCWRPITPSLAPVPHRTSPGSSATSVQLAPKKNGRRLVVPVTAVNPLGPPSGLSARRSHLSSLHCPRCPSWHSRADLATPCRHTRALHTRSLLSATCATSRAEEPSSLLCGVELLSDGTISRLPRRWSSLQEHPWQCILFHKRLVAIVRHVEDPWDGGRPVARDRRPSVFL